LKFKNIVVEFFGIILLVFGIEKLRVAMRSEEYLAIINNDMEKYESLTSQTFGELLADNILWSIGAFIIGFIIIIISKILNRKNKGLLNSLIAFILVLSLFPLGFFNAEFTNAIVNFVGGIMTDNFKYKFLINGILWTLIGTGIIWLAIKLDKKHYTQQRL
jgi:hypothetical protein